MVFYNFSDTIQLEININNLNYKIVPAAWEIIEFSIPSKEVEKISILYKGEEADLSSQYKKISLNHIYYDDTLE